MWLYDENSYPGEFGKTVPGIFTDEPLNRGVT